MIQSPSLSLLRADGADAADFLQGQLTLDITRLRPMHWAPSGYCSVQGKVLALFWVLRLEQNFLLACTQSLATAIGERLRRFTLHRQVTICADTRTLFFTAASGFDDPRAINAPQENTLCFSPCTGLQAIIATTAPAQCLNPNAVILALIEARIPLLDTATQEGFLPQMLGLEELGGLDYDKGCYVGQEVVSRALHKAPVRRHLKHLRATVSRDAAPPIAGTPLCHKTRTAAVVVQAACTDATIEALAVVQDRYLESPLQERGQSPVFFVL